MPDPSLPAWRQMLGWGLLASLLLHWIAFDIMRARAWLPSGQARASLQVSLRAAVAAPAGSASGGEASDTPRQPLLPRIKPVLPAPVLSAPDSPLPYNERAGRQDGKVQPAVAQQAKEGASADMPVAGLRSGIPAEAMTGLRLALAQRLGKASLAVIGSTGAQRMLLWCDFDAEGRVLEVRGAAGVVDSALQASVRQALGQLVLPAALVGKAFSLDVLLESGD